MKPTPATWKRVEKEEKEKLFPWIMHTPEATLSNKKKQNQHKVKYCNKNRNVTLTQASLAMQHVD